MIEFMKYDFYRQSTNHTFRSYLKNFFLSPGFNYVVWFRLASKYKNGFMKYLLHRKMIQYGIEIYPETDIGKGFYIGHWGNIVINKHVKIGENCNISQGVTIGIANGGKHPGVPTIGDRVYIGPGAKIFGNITIGNDVAIGANAVVINDIPHGVSVGGIPAKIISNTGSANYIHNIS
ncbi:MAG: serine O-acetyltransferase [Sulfuricurvum sp.]|uniref:serine O-acetyltransferase n=1 Tax=Sulfuricurvum sp. TaxID=2025608 RepID=UPI0026290341|nr:serine O-acetyltransferase [Sulfuricurvum sp.]MDD5158978.1 serine O-acetyltransferase [Sulfuricurvum sp.]